MDGAATSIDHFRVTRRTLLGATAAALGGLALGRPGSAAAARSIRWRTLRTDDRIAPRWDHVLGADTAGTKLLLFGGRDANGGALGDTWLFDLQQRSWSPVEGVGPEPRFGSALAPDPGANRLCLFGGEGGATFFNDSWLFDFESGAWTKVDHGDSALPAPRYGLSGAFAGDGRFLISHGFTFEGRYDDTWALDLATGQWTDISPAPGTRPLRRCLHEMAYFPTSNELVLFAGCSSGYGPCPQGDFWSLDVDRGTWSEITGDDGPAARTNPAMAFHPDPAQLVMFGGRTERGDSADLWLATRDAGRWEWTEITPAGDWPTARSSHDLALAGAGLYLFGGNTANGPMNDFWRLAVRDL